MKPEAISANPSARPRPSAAPSVPGNRYHPAVWRLALFALLFAGWMGYLGYLVYKQGSLPWMKRPTASLVLSRPQLLAAESDAVQGKGVDVIARLESADGPVTVEEVLFPTEGAPVRAGEKITVKNLGRCAGLVQRKDGQGFEEKADFTGPGLYLLPLREVRGGWEVAPTPWSPGYPGRPGPPRMYPDSPEVRAQYAKVPKPQRQ